MVPDVHLMKDDGDPFDDSEQIHLIRRCCFRKFAGSHRPGLVRGDQFGVSFLMLARYFRSEFCGFLFIRFRLGRFQSIPGFVNFVLFGQNHLFFDFPFADLVSDYYLRTPYSW